MVADGVGKTIDLAQTKLQQSPVGYPESVGGVGAVPAAHGPVSPMRSLPARRRGRQQSSPHFFHRPVPAAMSPAQLGKGDESSAAVMERIEKHRANR